MEVAWLNILPKQGGTGETNVYIDVTENERIGCTRTATVRFTNEVGQTAPLYLTQTSNTEDMYFDLSPDYIYVPGGGGTYYVNILTNTYWKVSDYDSSLTITTENELGYEDGVIKITIPVNPNTDNWYGYDHNGRPFYGRDGEITVTSLAGTKKILWEQAAYEAIRVYPKKLIFPSSGGSQTVTVTSSTDWSIRSYDSDSVSFSTLSGHSGETVVTVTKAPLTQTQKNYYILNASTAEFYDGANVALLEITSDLDGYFINDDYVTVTYYVPEDKVNTDMFLYRWITGKKEYYNAALSQVDYVLWDMFRRAKFSSRMYIIPELPLRPTL